MPDSIFNDIVRYKALRDRMRLLLYASTSVWFKVEGSYVLAVSGTLIVVEIVFNFLMNYRGTGGYTESLLYRGTARRLFHEVLQERMKVYVRQGRSYGASRQ
jgi:hypothetical protein